MGDPPFGCHPADWLPKVDEEENPKVYKQHCRSEDSRDDSNSVRFDPSENSESKPKGQSSLASNENTKQFRCVTIVTINLYN